MLAMLRAVLGNLLKRPATVAYPAGPKPLRREARGSVTLRADQCVFCGVCARKCPTGAIGVDRPGKRWAIRRCECIVCGCCVEVCPRKCLDMSHLAAPAGTRKTEEWFTDA